MPTDGPSTGPRGQGHYGKKVPNRKGDGPGATPRDGGHGGVPHTKPGGMSRGTPDDLRNGSPMKGPSMAGVLAYIKNKKGGGERHAPDSGGSAMAKGPEAGDESPYPTGGEPHEEANEGNDVPGESFDEEAAEGHEMGGATCGHPGCTKHKAMKYQAGNKEQRSDGKGVMR